MDTETIYKRPPNDIKAGDILLSSWGHTMILTTWVKVIKVSERTLLVGELLARPLDAEERGANKLPEPSYLQSYLLPTDQPKKINGQITPEFRLYPNKTMEGWHGRPLRFGSKLYFKKWDGRPAFEDHAD